MNWQQNTEAELMGGPCDGLTLALPPNQKTIQNIEVPMLQDLTMEWCKEDPVPNRLRPIRIRLYRRRGNTLRFDYVETKDDTEGIV